MAEWHLKALDDELNWAGWTVTERLAGDDYRISGTWQIERSNRDGVVLIDFNGNDDMVCLPIERAYGCEVRGDPDLSLYFSGQGQNWEAELGDFIRRLNSRYSRSTEAGSL